MAKTKFNEGDIVICENDVTTNNNIPKGFLVKGNLYTVVEVCHSGSVILKGHTFGFDDARFSLFSSAANDNKKKEKVDYLAINSEFCRK